MNRNNLKYPIFLLVTYTCLLFYWMLFGFGRTTLPEYSYNLKPLATIGFYLSHQEIPFLIRLINLVGNIAVFIPFGILLPIVWKKQFTKPLLIFWTGLLCLELLQLVSKKGSCDIDDFILNTIGYFIGYWLINQGKIIMKNRRLFYLMCTVILFFVEVLIALYVHDNIIRPYIGDVLVTILVYSFVRIFIPYRVKLLPLYVFLFACGVEFLQYLKIIEILGLSGNRIAQTIIGTSFSWIDILCYAIGCCVCQFYNHNINN